MKITTGTTQKDSQVVELAPPKVSTLHYDLDYDATNPEDKLRTFVSDMKGMVARFDYNKARIVEIEAELVDLYHYIEITPFKNVPDGYKLYRKMAELRRERRACKNENDLLQPVYEHFHATEVLNRLSHVQGEVAKCKSVIDSRTYTIRTDILDEYLEPPVKVVLASEDSEAQMEPVDDPVELKAPGKIEKKPMSAFKQVWRAAN